jgi:hypothetical protein
MPLTGGDINKIPPGPGGSARLRAGACRHLHDHRRGTTARPGRPFLPHGICRILTREKPCLLPAPPAWPPPPPCYPCRGQLPACPAAHRPWPAPGTGAPRTACRPPSLRHRATWPATRAPRSRSGRPQARTGRTWRYRSGSCSAAAHGWRSRRSWARGAVVRRPGTVLAVTEAGQIIGFNPAGPLDRAIPDLAAHQRAAFCAADSPSWPRDDQPQARQERQSPRPLPARGLPVPASVPWSWHAPGTPCARRHGGSPPPDGPCASPQAAPPPP